MLAILQRFRTMLFTEKADMQTAQEFYDRLMPAELPGTFYWKDFDYIAQPLAFWPAAQHYSRLQIILAAFGQDKLQDKIYVQKLSVMILEKIIETLIIDCPQNMNKLLQAFDLFVYNLL